MPQRSAGARSAAAAPGLKGRRGAQALCPGGAPRTARARGGVSALPPCRGPGARARGAPLAHPAGPCSPRRSSGTRSLGACVDGLGRSLGSRYRFTFFFFCCFAFNFLVFYFCVSVSVCVCVFFCPSWSQKETAAVSLQQKQRGRSFAGAARGSLAKLLARGCPHTASPPPGEVLLPGGCTHESCALSSPGPPRRSLQQPLPAPVSPMGGQRGCHRCPPRLRAQHPSWGSTRRGLGTGWSHTGILQPGRGNGVSLGPRAGPAPRGPQGCWGQADSTGEAGGRRPEQRGVTLRVWAQRSLAGAPAQVPPARPRLCLPGWGWGWGALRAMVGGAGSVLLVGSEAAVPSSV